MADNPGLEVRRVPIDSVGEDPDNVRTHDRRNIDSIKVSLTKFGQVEPLVIQKSSGRLIGGHGRITAMRELGWTEISITEVDIDDHKAKALGLALNRTAELANWDYRGLQEQLQFLQEGAGDIVEGLGWTPEEIETLVAATWDPPEPTGDLENTANSGPDDLSRRRFGIVGLDVSLTKEQRDKFNAALVKAREKTEFETDGDFVMSLIETSGYLEE